MQEWEGRLNVGMSNSVTTAIRGSVREMAIGKTKTTEKADRATVEQVNRKYDDIPVLYLHDFRYSSSSFFCKQVFTIHCVA